MIFQINTTARFQSVSFYSAALSTKLKFISFNGCCYSCSSLIVAFNQSKTRETIPFNMNNAFLKADIWGNTTHKPCIVPLDIGSVKWCQESCDMQTKVMSANRRWKSLGHGLWNDGFCFITRHCIIEYAPHRMKCCNCLPPVGTRMMKFHRVGNVIIRVSYLNTLFGNVTHFQFIRGDSHLGSQTVQKLDSVCGWCGWRIHCKSPLRKRWAWPKILCAKQCW